MLIEWVEAFFVCLAFVVLVFCFVLCFGWLVGMVFWLVG